MPARVKGQAGTSQSAIGCLSGSAYEAIVEVQRLMMKFYMTPGSCSTGIHILLEELGLVFEVHPVNLLAGDQLSEAYLAINPKGTIPTLVLDDGSALTDFLSIAWWLARSHPQKGLLRQNPGAEAEVLEMMSYVVNTLHGEGFARIFVTERFALRETDHEAVRLQGMEILERGFAVVDRQLNGRDYIADSFTIVDAALFYVEFWADQTKVALPDNCSAHYQRMLKRPIVRQVLMEEGYGRILMS
jgi:glutathione S-transferase